MPTASQLLFSSAKKRLDSYDSEVLAVRTVGHLLQGLQNELVITKCLRSLADAQVKTNLRLNELQTIVSKAEEEKAAELKALEEKLTQEAGKREKELVQQAEELKKELAEERRLKQEAQEECNDMEAEVTMFVRAQISHQFLIQKLPESQFRGYIDAYLQMGSMSDLGPAPSVVGDAEVGNGLSRKGHEDVGDNVEA